MIATARGLAVLAALAGMLLVAALVFGPARHVATDRSLMAGFDEKRVNELVFTRDGQSIRVSRGGGNQWRVQDPPGVAEPATIDAVFTALRGGRWHRRGKPNVAGKSRAQLTIGTTTLSINDPLPGTEQTWLVRGDDALLVDSWIANALTPEPLALRVRHPIDCASSPSIMVAAGSTLKIVGTQLIAPQKVRLDRGWLDRLYAACAQVEIVELRETPLASAPGLQMMAEGELSQIGTCEHGRIFVRTSAGSGCVEEAPLRAINEVAREISAQPDLVIDRRPLPIDPVKLTFDGGRVLELGGHARIDGIDADPERVRELLRVLSTRVSLVPLPRGSPPARITAVDRAGTEVVLNVWPGVVARDGEGGALALPDESATILARPLAALRDPTRWREDATTISSITVDEVTYTRGAVLGEWSRSPAGKLDPTLVDALAETLATVRAPAGPRPGQTAHRLTVTFSPPVGLPTGHTLAVAVPTEQGCAAHLDDTDVALPLPLCMAAVALAASQH